MTKHRKGEDPVDEPLAIPPPGSPGHDEAALDEAIAETFPASDPISPSTTPSKKPAK